MEPSDLPESQAWGGNWSRMIRAMNHSCVEPDASISPSWRPPFDGKSLSDSPGLSERPRLDTNPQSSTRRGVYLSVGFPLCRYCARDAKENPGGEIGSKRKRT